jgi:hypothetical protein
LECLVQHETVGFVKQGWEDGDVQISLGYRFWIDLSAVMDRGAVSREGWAGVCSLAPQMQLRLLRIR